MSAQHAGPLSTSSSDRVVGLLTVYCIPCLGYYAKQTVLIWNWQPECASMPGLEDDSQNIRRSCACLSYYLLQLLHCQIDRKCILCWLAGHIFSDFRANAAPWQSCLDSARAWGRLIGDGVSKAQLKIEARLRLSLSDVTFMNCNASCFGFWATPTERVLPLRKIKLSLSLPKGNQKIKSSIIFYLMHSCAFLQSYK